MEKQVPTVEVEIGEEKVVLYQWLTQEEEDKFNSIMVGDVEMDPNDISQRGKPLKIKISLSKVNESNKFLIESMCQSHKWEVINNWNPKKRKDLLEKINEVKGKN